MYSLSLAPETVIETHKNSSHDNILPKIDPVDFFLFLSHPITVASSLSVRSLSTALVKTSNIVKPYKTEYYNHSTSTLSPTLLVHIYSTFLPFE